MEGAPLSPLLGISATPTAAGREQPRIPTEQLRGMADGTLLKGTIEDIGPDGLIQLKTPLGLLQFKVEATLQRHLMRGQEMLLRVVQQPGQELPAVRPLTLDHTPIGQLTRPGHASEATLTSQLAATALPPEQKKSGAYNHLRPLPAANPAPPTSGSAPSRPPLGTLMAATLTDSTEAQQQFREQLRPLLSGASALLARDLPTALSATPARPLPMGGVDIPASTSRPAQPASGGMPPPLAGGATTPAPAPGNPLSPHPLLKTGEAAPPPTASHALSPSLTSATISPPAAASPSTATGMPVPSVPASSPPPFLPTPAGASSLPTPTPQAELPPASGNIAAMPATPATSTAPLSDRGWFIRIVSYAAPQVSPAPATLPTPPPMAPMPPTAAALPPFSYSPDAWLTPEHHTTPPPPSPHVPTSAPTALPSSSMLLAGASPLLTAPILNATVIRQPDSGQLLLATPAGQFAVPQGLSLPEGETMQITLELATPSPATSSERLPRWVAMEQLLQQVNLHLPQLLPLLDIRLPRPNLHLAGTTLLFLTALKGSNPLSRWLGEESLRQLESRPEFSPLLQRLQGELQQLARLPDQPSAEQPWQMTLVPLWGQGGDIHPLIILQRDGGRQQHGDGTETRHFTLEMEFRHTGPLQLEGLWRAPLQPNPTAPNKQFSLTLKSLRPLPEPMPQELRSLYSGLMEGFGFSGQLRLEVAESFTTDAELHLALEHLANFWAH